MTEREVTTRLPLVDAARGVGLVMMVVYHAAWDLSWFGYLDTDVGADPGWKAFAWATAALFLVVVGVSLVLATRHGLDRRRWLSRLAGVAAAALLVSVATFWLFPSNWIFFGILHHIALASVLAMPFVHSPLKVTLVTAVAVLAAPAMFSMAWFDAAPLQWIGLGTFVPDSNDFVPLMPWFAAVLVGVLIARLLLSARRARAVAARRHEGRLWRWLCLAGRHTLLVYLLHQPLLYGAVATLTHIWPPAPAPLSEPQLMDRCVRGCVNIGGGVAGCEFRCACAAATLEPLGLWQPAMSGVLESDAQTRVRALLQACPPG